MSRTNPSCESSRVEQAWGGKRPRLRYAASLCRAVPLMIAASFPAIMIVGALVLVEVTAGITEASMTRSPRVRAP